MVHQFNRRPSGSLSITERCFVSLGLNSPRLSRSCPVWQSIAWALSMLCLAGSLSLANAGDAVTGEKISKEQITQWVEDLSDDSYLRRKRATMDLSRVGQRAVEPLVAKLDSGDLETTARAISILQEIAAEAPITPAQSENTAAQSENPHPDHGGAQEPNAWDELLRISTLGGSRGTRAQLAVDEIRDVRHQRAIQALSGEGVFIGITEFIIGARSEQKRIVQFNDDFTGSEETLALLQWIDEIEYVRVEGKSIRKDVLEGIVEMPDLKTLALVQGEIDAGELRVLGAISELRRLEFRYVPMSGELIDQLATLPIRVSLTLNGTSAPAERVAALQKTVPGLEIIFKQGGFLGVKCYDNFNECLINEVVRGQGAEKAGLLPGDVVVAVDGKPIKQFKDLQKAIDAHMPGETIKIRYKRAGSERETIAQLGKLKEQ